MNTPSHHRVHHGRNPCYLDANYAGVLIVWDKMFGTFNPLRVATNPLRVATHEWISIFKDVFQRDIRLGDRLKYMFAPRD